MEESYLFSTMTADAALATVQRNGLSLYFFKSEQKTPELCMAAVRQNAFAIRYVEDSTPELCMVAVQRNGSVIRILSTEQRTPKVCLAAVKQDGGYITYLTPAQRSPSICLAAAKASWGGLQFTPEEKRRMCVWEPNRHFEFSRDSQMRVILLLCCTARTLPAELTLLLAKALPGTFIPTWGM